MDGAAEYIPTAYSRTSIALAAALGMRVIDEEQDLDARVDTLCLSVTDFVLRAQVALPTGTEDHKCDAVVEMMDSLATNLEPRRLVVSMLGPVVLQQLANTRIDAWQQGEDTQIDLPGTPSCKILTLRIQTWLQKQLPYEAVFCSSDIPGDALYKIRQLLRLSPPSRGQAERCILYGRNNPHVLTSLALAPDIEVDLLYMPPEGDTLFLRQPQCSNVLPYLVAYDYTFMPPPPPGLISALLACKKTDMRACAQAEHDKQEVPVGSYEEHLQFVRGAVTPPVPPEEGQKYMKLVRALYFYYTDGRMDNASLYEWPCYPTTLIYSLESQRDEQVHELHVLPTNVQLALILGSRAVPATHGVPVSLLASKLPSAPAPLPLRELLRVLRDSPTMVSDGMSSSKISIAERSGAGPAHAARMIPMNTTAAILPVDGEL